jgi:DNA-binding transcriptional regulator/RsmH inhibitor MraZ
MARSQNKPILTGEYPRRIDSQGRLSYPVKLSQLFSSESEIYLYHNRKEGCLLLMHRAELGRYISPLRIINYNIHYRRLSLPREARELAGLGDDVVVVGIGDAVEIWNRDRWEHEKTKFRESENTL